MSATIYFQPVRGKALDIGAPSSFLTALREAFHSDGEIRLSSGDYHTLAGLRSGLTSTDQKKAIDVLMEAVYSHDEVRVWPEY